MDAITPDENRVLGTILNEIRIARGQLTGEQKKLILVHVSPDDVTIDSYAIHQKRGRVCRNGLTGANGNG